MEVSHRGMDNVLNCDMVVQEFKLKLHYYIYFRTNTLGKDMIFFIPSKLLLFYKDGFDSK